MLRIDEGMLDFHPVVDGNLQFQAAFERVHLLDTDAVDVVAHDAVVHRCGGAARSSGNVGPLVALIGGIVQARL